MQQKYPIFCFSSYVVTGDVQFIILHLVGYPLFVF